VVIDFRRYWARITTCSLRGFGDGALAGIRDSFNDRQTSPSGALEIREEGHFLAGLVDAPSVAAWAGSTRGRRDPALILPASCRTRKRGHAIGQAPATPAEGVRSSCGGVLIIIADCGEVCTSDRWS